MVMFSYQSLKTLPKTDGFKDLMQGTYSMIPVGQQRPSADRLMSISNTVYVSILPNLGASFCTSETFLPML